MSQVTPQNSLVEQQAVWRARERDGNVSNWLRETFTATQSSQRLAGNAKEVHKRQKQLSRSQSQGGRLSPQITPRKAAVASESGGGVSNVLSNSSSSQYPASSVAHSPTTDHSTLHSEPTTASAVVSPLISNKGSTASLAAQGSANPHSTKESSSPMHATTAGAPPTHHQQQPQRLSRVSFPLDTDFAEAKVPSNYLPTHTERRRPPIRRLYDLGT